MSTNTPFATLFGGADRSAIDLPVAGLAGLAVAFAMFTIPDDLLAQAVDATGIANIIAAAQPPLGTTARIVLAAAGAITAFFGAFLLLRWLDRFALRSPLGVPEVIEAEGPRIRKSDAHPDAPPCRPISASRDLGEPAPPARPISARRDPVESVLQASVVEPEPPRPAAHSAPAEPRAVHREMTSAPAARPAPPAVRAAPAAAPVASQTLTDLMARLEQGLVRREQKAAPAPADNDTPVATAEAAPQEAAPAEQAARTPAAERSAAPPPPTPSNDRLQSAMDGLRALSVRV